MLRRWRQYPWRPTHVVARARSLGRNAPVLARRIGEALQVVNGASALELDRAVAKRDGEEMTRFKQVEQLLEEAVGRVFPAAQLLVVDGEEVVYEQTAGDATAETLFDLASLSKPLCTAMLAMLLCERGLFTLESEARPTVTMRHLLEHSSGLPAWRRLTPIDGIADVRAGIVEAVRQEPLISAPGQVARYSDLGFILLAGLLEQIAAQRLDRLFASEIARPLGITTTFTPLRPAQCAPTELQTPRGVVHDENSQAMGGVAGHAGLFSTARGVSAIVASLVRSFAGSTQSLVSPSTVRLFWTPSPVPNSTWCLGWDRPSAEGSSAGTRWPRSGVGHLGFTGCSLWIDPARARWVILLSNRVHPTRANESIKVFRPILHNAIVDALERESRT